MKDAKLRRINSLLYVQEQEGNSQRASFLQIWAWRIGTLPPQHGLELRKANHFRNGPA
jgi:hypothetical protein